MKWGDRIQYILDLYLVVITRSNLFPLLPSLEPLLELHNQSSVLSMISNCNSLHDYEPVCYSGTFFSAAQKKQDERETNGTTTTTTMVFIRYVLATESWKQSGHNTDVVHLGETYDQHGPLWRQWQLCHVTG